MAVAFHSVKLHSFVQKFFFYLQSEKNLALLKEALPVADPLINVCALTQKKIKEKQE